MSSPKDYPSYSFQIWYYKYIRTCFTRMRDPAEKPSDRSRVLGTTACFLLVKRLVASFSLWRGLFFYFPESLSSKKTRIR